MKADAQQRRRKQNQYDFYNKSYDKVFDEDKHPENMKYLLDETQNPEYIMEQKEKLLIENAKKEEQRKLLQIWQIQKNGVHIQDPSTLIS